jgi:Ca2+-binding RTX toxin-like protein
MRSLFVVAMLLTAALAALGQSPASANGNGAPYCFDPVANAYVQATKWLEAPGTLVGTSTRDVLVGSTGSDVIEGKTGDDVICGQPLDPDAGEGTIFPSLVDWQADTINAGSGNDAVIGSGNVKGGSGDDSLIVTGGPISGESGNDRISFISSSPADIVIDGGSGRDKIFSNGAITLLGGSGGDLIVDYWGAQRIDCGPGRDTADSAGSPVVRRCERVVTPA